MAFNDRITWVISPGQQIISTGCQADDLGMNPGIQQCRGAMIIDGAPRPAPVGIGSPRGWRQGDWQVSPMDQIGADGVPPVNSFGDRTIRIVLVEEVILPLPLD